MLAGLLLALAVLGALPHEMSRDELHAWLVARDSANLWDVFQVTRYEAHFVSWRVLLFGITRCTHNLANGLFGVGRRQEAMAHFEEALRLRPDSPQTRSRLTRLRGDP